MIRTTLLAAITLVIVCVTAPSKAATKETAEAKPVAIGQKVANFTFKDLRYLPRTIDEFGEDTKAYVLVFTTLDCPLVQRYLPRIKELDEQYRDQGVQFISINVGPKDSIVEAAYQGLKIDAEFPFCKDFDGDCVRALGVTRTPEVVVIDAQKRLRFRGRIDSQYRLGGVKPNRGREDLKEAIEDVLAGRDVRVAETPVDGCLITFQDVPTLDYTVTFAEHIAPILQQHCQECHHENTSAPFNLLTYEDVSSQGEMIAEVVREKRMPPCYSAAEHGTFINHREMTAEEIARVINWVNSGMKQGDPSKAPRPIEFSSSKWRIDEPDLVVTVKKPIEIQASGYIPYKYAILPHMFQEDTWVQQVEILPSNRAAQHHCNMAYVPLGGDWSKATFVTGQVPGGDAMILGEGMAVKIPKGSVLVLQIHYVSIGEETNDQTSVGFVFAKEKIQKELHNFTVADFQFTIPPGASHHQVRATRTFDVNASVLGLFAHMHLRGKDMTFKAHYGDGTDETLLVVPNYSFDWQMAYRYASGAKKFPKGTEIECVAHFDNSAFNPYNPDPTDTVKYGPQTYHEMMFGFVFYTDDDEELNLDVDPNTGHAIAAPEPDEQAAR